MECNSKLATRPLLYTDTIKGEQVFRDDMWAVTTEELNQLEDYREHLRFLYRWISRLNGDKPHDRPESEWKSYVEVMVHYPSSPWQTGDWFED